MAKILVKERNVVVPGQELADGMDYLPSEGAFREGEKIFSSKLGLFNLDGRLIKVIPLGGKYIPKKNDTVIGRVTDVSPKIWRIDIGWAFDVVVPLREGSRDFIPNDADLTKYYDIGDLVVAKIINVLSPKIVDASMKLPGCRKLGVGRVIKVESSRVPRIIGKQGSMITLIKDATGCNITVGQNGLIWISGEDSKKERLAEEAIRKIEAEAHSEGLTDKINNFLKESK
ncbi:exosome complex protein Rrp4 [archaeon]|nr:exosome complex protein Rrp4 [archaeon]